MDMPDTTRTRTPLGVALIAGFYLPGAVVLLICVYTNQTGMSRMIGPGLALSGMKRKYFLSG
jgi:hypothetical protein